MGIETGFAGGVGLGHLMRSLLFGIESADATCYVPAGEKVRIP